MQGAENFGRALALPWAILLPPSGGSQNVFPKGACHSMHVSTSTASGTVPVFLKGCYHRSDSFTSWGRPVYRRESYGPDEMANNDGDAVITILGLQHQVFQPTVHVSLDRN